MSTRGFIGLFMIVALTTVFYRLPPIVAEQDSVYRTYAPLVEVDALIRREYVTPVVGDRLTDGAIRGLLLDLDRYSSYVNPTELATYRQKQMGRYIGIGIEIGEANGSLVVISPVGGGPAMAAGVSSGDVILAIDGEPATEMSVYEAELALEGTHGSSVSLRWRRADGSEVERPVRRSMLHRVAVRGCGRTVDGGQDFVLDEQRRIGYVRVLQFGEGVTEALMSAVEKMMQDGMTSFVLDLRFNPGGLFTEAIAMVDRFVDRGTIVKTVNRRRAIKTFKATVENSDLATPFVVLINHATASSAEIVAGSLQDNGRATVIGERSFGKGSVQNLIEIQHGEAGLRLTVALYQLPKGRIIHKSSERTDWGVDPDVVVAIDDEQYAEIVAQRQAVDKSVAMGALQRLLIDRQLAEAIRVLSQRVPLDQ